MARVKVALPDNYIFSTQYTIAVTDLNYGAHLGNDKLMSIVHEARYRFYKEFGFSEMDVGDGIGTMMADAAIQYKSEGFAGDVIEIVIAVNDFSRVGFDVVYKMENVTTGKPLAWVKTGIVCYDYDLKSLTTVPEVFISAVNKASL